MALSAEEKAAAKAKKEEEKSAEEVQEEEVAALKLGIVKEWMHNGFKMRRIRDEDGRVTDVRL